MGAQPPSLPGFDVAALIAAARKQTGLEDFGQPDVEEPLRRIITSFLTESRLSEASAAAQQMNLMRLLANRLLIEKELKDHPEILDQAIRGPIIIIGLPRSGTTKLQRMIAADTALQKIPFWRMLHPVPLDPAGPDTRIAIAEAVTAYTRANFPPFQTAHPMGAMEPEEEDFLMEHSFATSVTYWLHRMPTYLEWVINSDPKPYYDQLLRFLQIFQWQDHGAGKMWLLKATCHLHRMRWLLEAFPEATIVHCHRDPVTSLTSMADMFFEARRMSGDGADPIEVATATLDYSSWQMKQYLAQRTGLESRHRFVDVSFGDVVSNPFKVIDEIYGAAGIEVTDKARLAMREWERDNPEHKHGRRDYGMEKLGFTEARLRAAMTPYIERYSRYL